MALIVIPEHGDSTCTKSFELMTIDRSSLLMKQARFREIFHLLRFISGVSLPLFKLAKITDGK